MIKVQRFINQLLSSNCFIVYDDETHKAIVIDPGSEKSEEEIRFIEKKKIVVDYIILTHEHTDHNWGVNSLLSNCPNTKLVCSLECDKLVKKTNHVFFSLYRDDPEYNYTIPSANILIKSDKDKLVWNGNETGFLLTPGHSRASMCISLDGMLFTGDTITSFPPFFNKRDSNVEEWKTSISKIITYYPSKTIVYPGHGESLTLGDWTKVYHYR